MSDIAIAFSIVDADMSEKIALAVEDHGLKVLRAPLTPTALDKALVVVAIWSATSVRSAVVNDVARLAAEAGKLVSVNVGAADIPDLYVAEGAHDLAHWNGIARGPTVDDFLSAVSRLAEARRFTRGAEPARPPARRELSMSSATRLAGEGVTAAGMLVRSPPTPEPGSAASTAPAPMAPAHTAAGGGVDTAERPSRTGSPSRREQRNADPILFEPEHNYLVREAQFWVGIRDSGVPADYLRYLESFGEEGVFAELARYRLRLLRPDQADDSPKSRKKGPDRRRARSGGVSRMGFGIMGVTVVAAAAVLHFAKPALPTFVPQAEAYASVVDTGPEPIVEARETRVDPVVIPPPAPVAAAALVAEPPPPASAAVIRAAPMDASVRPVSFVSVQKAPPREVAPLRRAYTSSVAEPPRPMDLAAVDLAPVALDLDEQANGPVREAPVAFEPQSHAQRSAASAALAVADLQRRLQLIEMDVPLTPIPALPTEADAGLRVPSLRPIAELSPVE
jgi:hypothetical protein